MSQLSEPGTCFRVVRMVLVAIATVSLLASSGCSSTDERPSDLAAVAEASDSSWVGSTGIAVQFEMANNGGATTVVDIAPIGGLELVEAAWSEEGRTVGPAIEPPLITGLPVAIPSDSIGRLYLHWRVLNCAGLGTQELIDGDGGVLFSIDQVPLTLTVTDPDVPLDGLVDPTRTVAFDPIHHPNQHVVALYDLDLCS